MNSSDSSARLLDCSGIWLDRATQRNLLLQVDSEPRLPKCDMFALVALVPRIYNWVVLSYDVLCLFGRMTFDDTKQASKHSTY